MLAIFITLLSITIILMICMLKDEDTNTGSFSTGIMIGIALLSLLIGIFMCIFKDSETEQINPIDVYRGKTELRIIEIKENNQVIKRDTTVIFKNNIK